METLEAVTWLKAVKRPAPCITVVERAGSKKKVGSNLLNIFSLAIPLQGIAIPTEYSKQRKRKKRGQSSISIFWRPYVAINGVIMYVDNGVTMT